MSRIAVVTGAGAGRLRQAVSAYRKLEVFTARRGMAAYAVVTNGVLGLDELAEKLGT